MMGQAHKIERRESSPEMAALAELRWGEQQPKMLIADDDPLIVRLLAHQCMRMGFEVETASDGIQAFLKVCRGKPDILVIDVDMPELDGLSICDRLLDADRVPANVIVITGSRNPQILERCEGLAGHCARKGPNFWNDLDAAFTEIDPRMAGRLRRAARMGEAPATWYS